MEIISVVYIRDGVVDDIQSYTSNDKAESEFKILAKRLNSDLTEDDMEEALTDGYVSIMNASVCITHSFTPDIDELPAYMRV